MACAFRRRPQAVHNLHLHKSACLPLFGQKQSISTGLVPSTFMCSQNQWMATIDAFCLRYVLLGILENAPMCKAVCCFFCILRLKSTFGEPRQSMKDVIRTDHLAKTCMDNHTAHWQLESSSHLERFSCAQKSACLPCRPALWSSLLVKVLTSTNGYTKASHSCLMNGAKSNETLIPLDLPAFVPSCKPPCVKCLPRASLHVTPHDVCIMLSLQLNITVRHAEPSLILGGADTSSCLSAAVLAC